MNVQVLFETLILLYMALHARFTIEEKSDKLFVAEKADVHVSISRTQDVENSERSIKLRYKARWRLE